MLEVKPPTSKQSESSGSSLLERILSLKLEKKKFRFGILVVFIIIIGWILSENKALEINTYSISSEKIPEVFHGYRIAQVSDLHNAEFGEDNDTLINMLKEASPDIIVITGDLVDSRNTKLEIGSKFAEQACSNGRTDISGTDNNQWFYEMECLDCGHRYLANGTDIWQRKCPSCQGGRKTKI